jgi:uncharacterized protein (TIGR00375 family)
MKVIADLHIHSKYARACSRDLEPRNLAIWAEKKGITVLGTGDFTHPHWLAELKAILVESETGLYQINGHPTRFMLTAEVASIYKQGEKVRRVHSLLLAPNFSAADKLIVLLEKRKVNLKSDGRPIMGVPVEELLKICKEAHSEIELIPAHAWTPHFGIYGSLSGFNSLEEAFGSMAKHVFAVETGLSSDPQMNWKVADLKNISLISNSDAHSLRKLGREANVFAIDQKSLSYAEIIRIIRDHDPAKFLHTIEFFPEEGKYHLDGHADCQFSCLPEETKRLGGICPVCGKKLLRGVLYRADELSGGAITSQRTIPFQSTIPLEEIIAETLGVGTASKKVLAEYEAMVAKRTEFDILLEVSQEEIARLSSEAIAESVIRVREGKVHITPGYDGIFGKIQIYSSAEREKMFLKPKQTSLF